MVLDRGRSKTLVFAWFWSAGGGKHGFLHGFRVRMAKNVGFYVVLKICAGAATHIYIVAAPAHIYRL